MSTSVRFYNSLSKQTEDFEPKDADSVRVYHCGPTVYKRQHIGNMRRFLFADFLGRALAFLGYEVREVTNITDVGHLTQDELDAGEDKLEVEAKKKKVAPQDIAQREIEQFLADLDALNIRRSDDYLRATDHIEDMQKLIQELLDRGHAYTTKTGVYFDVATFPAYGRLSGNTVEGLEAGARVEVQRDKRSPADFALWIFDEVALQKWDSPWGVGYPGWHVECSAMSMATFGTDIDIHTGGIDNTFPHHENEIAQSEGATGETFVRMWLHNAHLNMSGEKLAKRDGEQITLDTLDERGFSALAFRLLIFGSHYRSPIEFSWQALAAAQESLEHLKQFLRLVDGYEPPAEGATGRPEGDLEACVSAFRDALADDLNTPEALAAVMTYVRLANSLLQQRKADQQTIEDVRRDIDRMDDVLGVFGPLRDRLADEPVPASVRELVAQREQAREKKDFKEADRLREMIESSGFTVEDSPTGPRIIRTQ